MQSPCGTMDDGRWTIGSPEIAPEGRKRVAHGVSRAERPHIPLFLSPGGATEKGPPLCRPAGAGGSARVSQDIEPIRKDGVQACACRDARSLKAALRMFPLGYK